MITMRPILALLGDGKASQQQRVDDWKDGPVGANPGAREKGSPRLIEPSEHLKKT
jgi:hypothetical protein